VCRTTPREEKSSSTTFDLVDRTGNTLQVVTEEPTTVRAGLEIVVEGRLILRRSANSSSPIMQIEADYVEPTSPREKVATQLAPRLPAKKSSPAQPQPPVVTKKRR
jgi:hypothetical protein